MRIAAIPGDGIGREVLPEAARILDAALARTGEQVTWTWLEWGCDYFVEHGRMMPVDGISVLAAHDAIFLGAVGRPDVPDHESLWGLLIPIRREFDQYVNLRPIRLLPGIESRVLLPAGQTVDMLIVRENTEGEYSEMGGRFGRGSSHEFAIQENVFTRRGVERIARYAMAQARMRSRRVTSATKSNGIVHTMPFWDEVVSGVAAEFPDVECSSRLVDALAADLVLRPQSFDVIVGSNLFGDILSDLAAAVVGSLGVAASANLNPERRHPSMFEPVHGSAPDIAGKGIANPVGAVWSGAMMLDHLGFRDAAELIMLAVESSLDHESTRTADLGGSASTDHAATAMLNVVATAHRREEVWEAKSSEA